MLVVGCDSDLVTLKFVDRTVFKRQLLFVFTADNLYSNVAYRRGYFKLLNITLRYTLRPYRLPYSADRSPLL